MSNKERERDRKRELKYIAVRYAIKKSSHENNKDPFSFITNPITVHNILGVAPFLFEGTHTYTYCHVHYSRGLLAVSRGVY